MGSGWGTEDELTNIYIKKLWAINNIAGAAGGGVGSTSRPVAHYAQTNLASVLHREG